MRKTCLLALAGALMLAPSVSFAGGDPGCYETAMTQADINLCAADSLKAAQAEQEKLLGQIKSRHAGNPAKLAKIEKSQQAWNAYVESQIDMLYADHTGSAAGMCAANDRAYMTRQRTLQLKKWLEDNVEGNTCGGL